MIIGGVVGLDRILVDRSRYSKDDDQYIATQFFSSPDLASILPDHSVIGTVGSKVS